MSRIGKLEITIPDKVTIDITPEKIKVKGPNGELEQTIVSNIEVVKDGKLLKVVAKNEEIQTNANHGLMRALINNMVVGVSEGFKKELNIIGVGYKCQMKGADVLNLSVGHSHPVDFKIPKGVTCKVEGNTKIFLDSRDKQLLGQVAANIRAIRPPEVYKGKGIRYVNEVVRKKAGKATK